MFPCQPFVASWDWGIGALGPQQRAAGAHTRWIAVEGKKPATIGGLISAVM